MRKLIFGGNIMRFIIAVLLAVYLVCEGIRYVNDVMALPADKIPLWAGLTALCILALWLLKRVGGS
jgi:hypothetical protein